MAKGGDPYTAVTLLPVHFPPKISLHTQCVCHGVCAGAAELTKRLPTEFSQERELLAV